MSRIPLSHVRIQGLDVAIFHANARSNTQGGRDALLAQLTTSARAEGLRVTKSALAYRAGSGVRFHGTPDLVRYLAGSGAPSPTHQLSV